eukprot:Pgem_evm1s2300
MIDVEEFKQIQTELQQLLDSVERYRIGLMYYEEKKYSKALKYLELVDGDNKCNAQFIVGSMYHKREVELQHEWLTYFSALTHYERAADLGHLMASFILGTMYDYEETTFHCKKKALKYYKKAADGGYLGAHCYKFEQAEAFKYYKMAAMQDHCEAQFIVGNRYRDGNGVRRSLKSAKKYYKMAADQGHPEALHEYENLILNQ